MNKEEALKILNVKSNASEKDIDSAFRKLAAKNHPDLFQDEKEKESANEKFKQINEAYQILKNKQKPFSRVEKYYPGTRKVPDPVVHVNLTFIEAALGTTKELKYTRHMQCTACSGNGIKPTQNICTACNGLGGHRQNNGNMVFITQCNDCLGSGKEMEPCSSCDGEGSIENQVVSSVNFKGGILNTSKIHINHGGNYVKSVFGSTYGPLIIVPHVEEHKSMRISNDGNDIVSELNITLLEALKGTSCEVETIQGIKSLKIPPRIKNGAVIVKEGLGTNKSNKGKHVFNIHVHYPEVTDELISVLETQNGISNNL